MQFVDSAVTILTGTSSQLNSHLLLNLRHIHYKYRKCCPHINYTLESWSFCFSCISNCCASNIRDWPLLNSLVEEVQTYCAKEAHWSADVHALLLALRLQLIYSPHTCQPTLRTTHHVPWLRLQNFFTQLRGSTGALLCLAGSFVSNISVEISKAQS